MSRYAELILSHGPSNYWRLGESSGTTAVDIIGSKNGTISGGVTLNQPGALADGNAAMSFDGTTGQIATTVNVTIPAAMTLEVWLTYVNDGTSQPLISVGSGETPTWYLTATGGMEFFDAGPSVGMSGLGVLPAGSWQHLALVLTGTTGTFYVNGALNVTAACVRPLASTNLGYLGRDPAFGVAPNGFFAGALDEVAIYPRALTPTEISEHYAARLFTAAAHLDLNTDIAGSLGFTAGSDLTTLVSTYLKAHHTGDATKDMKALIDAAT